MLLVDVFYFRQVTVIWVTLRQGEPGALGLEPALLFRTSRLAPEQPLVCAPNRGRELNGCTRPAISF
jgi:hypothetical protein